MNKQVLKKGLLAIAMLPRFLAFAQDYHQAAAQLMTRWSKDVNAVHNLNAYPRPQLQRAGWQNLNGLWSYSITDEKATQAGSFDGSILVPYPIESALSGVKKPLGAGKLLWYKRKFTHAAAKGKTLLHFGAVDYKSWVYVNGKQAGSHEGGYTAFTLDITDLLKAGANELVVKVWDPIEGGYGPVGKQTGLPGGIFYTSSSGIWQTVWLEQVPDTYIDHLTIVPDVDRSCVQITVHSQKEGPVKIALNKQIYKGIANRPLKIKLTNQKLWSPGSPYLYDFTATLGADQVKSYFGMRKISIQKDKDGIDRIALNNKPYFNLGTLDQGFWPDGLYTAPTDEALSFDIKAIKAMGFNTIRKHIKVEPARWYYYCDKLGMLVWQDMVNPNPGLPPGAKEAFEKQNKEIIDQLYNSPSITTWVLFNERWGAYDQERLTRELKAADPTRLVNGHTGELLYVDHKLRAPAESPYPASDITDVHAYPDPMISVKQAGKAQVVGEFGGIGVPVAGHEWSPSTGWGYVKVKAKDLQEKYAGMVAKLEELQKEGLSGSIYTEPFDVEGEENGLVTYDRKVAKIPFDALRKIHVSLNPEIRSETIPVIQLEPAGNTAFDQQYQADLKRFNEGNHEQAFIQDLASRARWEGDTASGEQLIAAYIATLRAPYTREQLEFTNLFNTGVNAAAFRFLFDNRKQVDHILGPRSAYFALSPVISKDLIDQQLKGNANWQALASAVSSYGEIGPEILAQRKIEYYLSRKDWGQFLEAVKVYTGRYPESQEPFVINNWMMEIFNNCEDKAIAGQAADLMPAAIQREKYPASLIDTYATLLYKSGKKEEGISWEEKAVAAALKQNDEGLSKGLQETVDKMKKGEKIW